MRDFTRFILHLHLIHQICHYSIMKLKMQLNLVCVFRAAVGVSDLHRIWFLSEHRFTEPALQWISLTVRVCFTVIVCLSS